MERDEPLGSRAVRCPALSWLLVPHASHVGALSLIQVSAKAQSFTSDLVCGRLSAWDAWELEVHQK